MRPKPLDVGTLHFIGIGGIGMSGIAEVLHARGYDVQGSDLSDSLNVKRLQDKGMVVHVGHKIENLVTKADELPTAVVVSSAIKPDNPELKEARSKKIPVIRRADMLAELMRMKSAVAVGGTHGKTTTTTLVSAMLEEGNFDPTVINGGIVNRYGTNTRMGKGEWMVVEADESDGTFTRLPATVAVVTNIDPEHMEHYGEFKNLRKAFKAFIENIPFYGFAVLCLDHAEVQAMVPELTDRKIVTYGFNPQADVRVLNLETKGIGSAFDVQTPDGVLKDMYLPMPGRHNVQNALASIAVGLTLGMEDKAIRKALKNFTGVKRRFTKTGEINGATIIDDYAHHPVEIEAVLKAARQAVGDTDGKIIALVQPHRYSRLSDLFDGFCTCFNEADTVIVADVYPAGEDPIEGADKEHLADGIKAHGHRDVHLLSSRKDLASMISDLAGEGDYVLFLGAGDVSKWANELPGDMNEC